MRALVTMFRAGEFRNISLCRARTHPILRFLCGLTGPGDDQTTGREIDWKCERECSRQTSRERENTSTARLRGGTYCALGSYRGCAMQRYLILQPRNCIIANVMASRIQARYLLLLVFHHLPTLSL